MLRLRRCGPLTCSKDANLSPVCLESAARLSFSWTLFSTCPESCESSHLIPQKDACLESEWRLLTWTSQDGKEDEEGEVSVTLHQNLSSSCHCVWWCHMKLFRAFPQPDFKFTSFGESWRQNFWKEVKGLTRTKKSLSIHCLFRQRAALPVYTRETKKTEQTHLHSKSVEINTSWTQTSTSTGIIQYLGFKAGLQGFYKPDR